MSAQRMEPAHASPHRVRRVCCFAVVGLLFGLVAERADAQCASVSTAPQTGASGGTVSASLCMPIKDVLRLQTTSTLTPPSGLNSTTFTASNTPAASSTYVPFGGKVTLTVAANRPFAVTVSGSFTGPGAKTASDALWSTTQNIFTNSARNVSAANPVANRTIAFPGGQPANTAWVQDVYFASRWVYETDKSGSYTLTLTFTISAQ